MNSFPSFIADQAIKAYTKGTKAWFSDKKEGWVPASCVSNETIGDKVFIHFKSDIDGKKHIFESTLVNISNTKGSTLPPLRNPPKLECTDDLTNLSYLNEPSVLNTIRTRYMQHLIYTYSGIVLIAVNPFDHVSLYEPDMMQQYSGKRRNELEPHLFAIAEEAYRCMVKENKNQTIVVSGESGAGKTMSAKFIMRYFATVENKEVFNKSKKSSNESVTEIEEQILATNPIMESFGNAKTTRNDNSSRFGRYIEIEFDKFANIVGAKIRTYLLERSRLVFQPKNERNYHIFYQLCAGISSKRKEEFKLGDYKDFNYLNQSGVGHIKGIDDKEEFQITQKALSTIGLSVEIQWQIFRILAALLHLGNIQITGRADAIISDSDKALENATQLLGVSKDEFKKWIVRRQITTRSDKIISNLNPTQAHVVKDSVAKYIYSCLFDWLVDITNQSLSNSDIENVTNFIGVLDIYGFEHFKINSFEQFCINYANEKLQQQFNEHVFKLEQEEYMNEKIDWTFIEFSDNKKCIDLIESKIGILSLLDEESRLPAGTDQAFCQKLYDNFTTDYKEVFKKPRFSQTSFSVAHYAHEVQYETENFLEKNKDSVPDEHLHLLKHSDFSFLHDILIKRSEVVAVPNEVRRRSSMMLRKPTLASIFKQSLVELMDTISRTNVHYIRCIKPNEDKAAWEFEGPMALSQLRACGVLETIRISCCGYPSKSTFEDFVARYYILIPSKHWETVDNIKTFCSLILEGLDSNQYQIGQTKIFFRAGQLAQFEKRRTNRLNACATTLQKHMRRYVCRLRYNHFRVMLLQVQSLTRQRLALAQLNNLKRSKAVIIIQTQVRRWIARKSYLNKLAFIVQLQTIIRARYSSQLFKAARSHKAAIVIQSHVRGMLTRIWYKRQINKLVLLQACVRRNNAKHRIEFLRSEAKSANHFKEVSYQLENKVVELTQIITSLKIENQCNIQTVSQLEEKLYLAKQKVEDIESKCTIDHVSMMEHETVKAENEKLYSDNIMATKEIESLKGDLNKAKEALMKEKKSNKEIIASLKQKLDSEHSEELATLRAHVSALKVQLAIFMQPRQVSQNRQVMTHSETVHYSQQPEQSQMTQAAESTSSQNLVLLPAQDLALTSTQTSEPQPQVQTSPAHPTKLLIHNTNRSTSCPEQYNISSEPKSEVHDYLKPLRKNSTLINRKTRRYSSGEMNEYRNKTLIEKIKDADNYTKKGKARPVSVGQSNTIIGGKRTKLDDPEDEINSILRQDESLQAEILEGLIRSLKYPMPCEKNPPSKEEVLFPAHLISMCVTDMWRIGYNSASESLLFSVMDAIQRQCLSFTAEDAIIPCAFWITNIHELLSLIVQSEQRFEAEMHERGHSIGWREFEKMIQTVKYEMQCLEDNVYHAWIRAIKLKYSKMIIPAVIENQALPGFVTSPESSNRFFFNKLLLGATGGPSFCIEDVVGFLDKLYRTMSCYHIESSVISQVLTELMKLTGVTAFNDLLMRRNFSTWKRAMQIQYNVTCIEDWCKEHGVSEGTLHLEHLIQATKLLQSKKSTLEDVNNMYEVCWMLSPSQILKLASHHYVADEDSLIRPDILRLIASRVKAGDKTDMLLLDTIPIDEAARPFEIPGPRETEQCFYLPAWLNLTRIRRLILLESELIEKNMLIEKIKQESQANLL